MSLIMRSALLNSLLKSLAWRASKSVRLDDLIVTFRFTDEMDQRLVDFRVQVLNDILFLGFRKVLE